MSDAANAHAVSTEELFRQHAPFVVRFLARLGVPPSHVEDALQEVFLVVHRHGGYRPGPAKPTSYLAGIAIHAATKHRRSERARRVRDSDTGFETLAGDVDDPTRALEAHEGLARLQAALDRLSDELRVTLVLAELEGESCLSIAAAMGLPVGTVYWRLHEARKKFQAALKLVDSERVHQQHIVAASSRSARSARRRTAAEPSLGMIMVFGMQSLSSNSEMEQLLRLGRATKPIYHGLTQGLARHQQLVHSGAPLPSWAANFTPHTASWFGLVGGGGVSTLVAAGAAVVMAVLMLHPVHSVPRSERTVSAVAVVAGAPAAVPAAAAPVANADSVPAAEPVEQRQPQSAEAPHPGGAARALPKRFVVPTSRAAVASTATPVPVAPTQPAPAVVHFRTSKSQEMLEMQEVAQAERLLAIQPARALSLVNGMQARFPASYFREERAYLEVMALLGVGRRDEARAKATRFLQTYPDGPYSRRVRAGTLPAGTVEP